MASKKLKIKIDWKVSTENEYFRSWFAQLWFILAINHRTLLHIWAETIRWGNSVANEKLLRRLVYLYHRIHNGRTSRTLYVTCRVFFCWQFHQSRPLQVRQAMLSPRRLKFPYFPHILIVRRKFWKKKLLLFRKDFLVDASLNPIILNFFKLRVSRYLSSLSS